MKININGKSVELSDEDVKAALDSEKKEIDVSADFIVRTVDEEKSFKENIRKEGVNTGAEIGRKEVIKGLGIEGDGIHKSAEATINSVNNFLNSKVEEEVSTLKEKPDERVKELTSDVQTLKTTISTLESEKQEIQGKFSAFKKGNKIRSTLEGLIPENSILPKDDMLTILQTKLKVDVDENENIFAIGVDGMPVKNPTTLELVPVKDVVEGFFSENQQYLKAPEGGAGGGDSGSGSGKQTLDEFTKEMTANDIKVNSEQFNAEMNERLKNGTLTV